MYIRLWISIGLFFLGVFFSPMLIAAKIAEEGYLLFNLKTHKILAEKDSQAYFNPASNLKLFTATAAILVLGENYTYKTWITFNPAAIHQHCLDGNVALVFSGDPLLKKEDIEHLLATLKTYGIRRISGDILLVANAFDTDLFPDGWPRDQLHICYSGPTHAINLDNNCFLFHVYATQKAHLIDIPSSVKCTKLSAGQPCVLNQAITSDDINCVLSLKNQENQYTISGCLKPGTYAQRMKIAIPNTMLYTETIIRQHLKKMGVNLSGSVMQSAQLPQTRPIETHASYPLKSLIRILLKYSDDLVANALFKTLGGVHYHAQGTWQRGIHAEKALFSEILGVKQKELFIFDGSGESYYNAITPQQMIKLLIYIQKTPKLARVILPALPINGADGTLVNRLRTYPSVIHAKTGTWRHVAALSGYVMRYNQQWAFSIFVNGMTPVNRGLADQADAWLLSVLPPIHPAVKKK